MSANRKRTMGARRGRVKGRTTAKVGSIAAIVHLDSTSDLHAEHQELSKKLHAQARARVSIPLPSPEPAKFPSLGKGLMFDGNGALIDSESHVALLTRLNRERGFYRATETRKNGTSYERKLPTVGIHQLAVTYYPVHSTTLARLDKSGIPVRDIVIGHTQKLGHEFARLTGYEVVAMQIHPNEGILHPHMCYATVDKENKLLHSLNGRGRRGLRFLGPACIGTLRLVENGVWPEDDAEMARRFLAGSVRKGQEPIDWVLSRYLDGLAEKSLMDLSKQFTGVADIWNATARDYKIGAIARREERPDLMAKRIEALASENDALRNELAQLKADGLAPTPEMPATGLLGLPLLGLPTDMARTSPRKTTGIVPPIQF